MRRKTSDTVVDVSGAAPLYKQVEERILQCLAEGEWKPGEQLPTESQLAERFKVAVFTIRAGISELVASSILVRKQGKGTFVARHSRQRQRYQFSHVYGNDGTQIFPDRSVLAFKREVAASAVADKLGLRKEDRQSVYHLTCLLTVGGAAASIMDIMLPARMFSKLTARAIRGAQENLYAVYQDECGINVIRVEEHVYATAAAQDIAAALKINTGSPLLRVERIAYTYQDVPVEYRVRFFDAAKFHYRTEEGGV